MAPYNYFGSTHVYPLIKKYYVPPEMQDVISNYISNNCPCIFTCDSINLVSGDGYFYRFKSYDNKKEVVYCCMSHKSDALLVYSGLENSLLNSKLYNKQSKEILSVLRLLMVVKPFNPPPDEILRIKKHLSKNDWQSYLEKKKKENDEIKKEIEIIIDSVEKS